MYQNTPLDILVNRRVEQLIQEDSYLFCKHMCDSKSIQAVNRLLTAYVTLFMEEATQKTPIALAKEKCKRVASMLCQSLPNMDKLLDGYVGYQPQLSEREVLQRHEQFIASVLETKKYILTDCLGYEPGNSLKSSFEGNPSDAQVLTWLLDRIFDLSTLLHIVENAKGLSSKYPSDYDKACFFKEVDHFQKNLYKMLSQSTQVPLETLNQTGSFQNQALEMIFEDMHRHL